MYSRGEQKGSTTLLRRPDLAHGPPIENPCFKIMDAMIIEEVYIPNYLADTGQLLIASISIKLKTFQVWAFYPITGVFLWMKGTISCYQVNQESSTIYVTLCRKDLWPDPVAKYDNTKEFKKKESGLFLTPELTLWGRSHIDRHVWRRVIVPSDFGWWFAWSAHIIITPWFTVR